MQEDYIEPVESLMVKGIEIDDKGAITPVDALFPVSKRWAENNGLNVALMRYLQITSLRMAPTLCAGDVVFIDLANVEFGDGAIVLWSSGGMPEISRLVKQHSQWYLSNDSSMLDDLRAVPSDITILGRVVTSMRAI